MNQNQDEQMNILSKSLIKNIDKNFLELIYKDLAQPSVQKVGKALSNVIGLGNTVLLPVKMINEKAILLYSSHMRKYKDKLDKIEMDKIIEVQPEIGVPIMEKLQYTTNENLVELYTNLLTNASDIENVNKVHHRYINIVSSISPDEIKIINSFGWSKGPTIDYISYVNMIVSREGSYSISNNCYTKFEKSTILTIPENSKMYFNNLISLGLIEKDEKSYSKNMSIKLVDELKKTRNYKFFKNNTKFLYGHYQLTFFGRSFIDACKLQKKIKL